MGLALPAGISLVATSGLQWTHSHLGHTDMHKSGIHSNKRAVTEKPTLGRRGGALGSPSLLRYVQNKARKNPAI